MQNNIHLQIRQEQVADCPVVDALIQAAFQSAAYSDQTEHLLVQRLRAADTFIPAFSIVAYLEEQIVGHILLSPITIVDGAKRHPSLALAPVSVLPEHQSKGIGGKLILHAHEVARNQQAGSIILLGHADYYPRFGYRPCQEYGIQLPFDVPAENCMLIELFPDALKGVRGMVEYPPAFSG